MAAIQDFFKQNLKGQAANIAFLPGYVKEVGEAQSKMKALIKVTSDWLFWSLKALAPWRAALYGGWAILGFKALGDAIKNIVKDTGSLVTALQKLQSIQITQRQLAPFVGGLGAAKQRVSELLALSSRGPFRFEEIASANIALEKFTRGAFSSVEATRAIGMAAINSGNNINDVADAVGNFYQTLRNGQPIEGAAEQLRQLGIVSGRSADQLVDMSKGGASSIEVFDRFSTEMEAASKSTKGFSDELTTVSAEHAKAAEALKVKFGAPWTAGEIQNTKNMTAAMEAIGPTLGRISSTLQIVFSGFNTATSGLAKFAAKNEVIRTTLETIVKLFAGLSLVLLTLGTATLPMVIPRIFALTAGLYGMGGAATAAAVALRALGSATVIGLVLMGAVAIAGAVYKQVQATKELDRETKNIEVSFRKANKEIKEQIGNIKTLADQHEALAKAMGQVVDSQDELGKAQAEYAQKAAQYEREMRTLYGGQVPVPYEETPEGKAMQKRIQILQKNAALAKETFGAGLRGRGGLISPEFEAATEQIRRRAFAREQQAYEARLAREPGRAPQLERERGEVLLRRAAAGRAGITARATVAERTAVLETERLRIQAERETAEREQERLKAIKSPTREERARREYLARQLLPMIRAREAGIGGQMLEERLRAPAGTAIRAAARAEQIRGGIAAGAALAAGKEEEAKRLRALAGGMIIVGEQETKRARIQAAVLENEAKILETYEKENVELEETGKNMINNSVLGVREQEIIRQTADIELARRIAQREGRSSEAVALKNQEAFIERYERYRKTIGETEGRQRALAETAEDIRERVIPGGPAAVVSTLQRIGGGGGIYAPGGDPTLETQKQIRNLISMSNSYLKTISSKGEGVK
jgi:hypothetical protein